MEKTFHNKQKRITYNVSVGTDSEKIFISVSAYKEVGTRLKMNLHDEMYFVQIHGAIKR